MAPSRVLVVGSGAIGLRTAVELVRRKISVVMRSPRHPLDDSVCSQGAGGLWMPFHCDDTRVDRWAMETLDELYPLVGSKKDSSLVELVPTISLFRDHTGPTTNDFITTTTTTTNGGEDEKTSTPSSSLPSWTYDSRLKFQHMTIEMLSWQNQHIHKLKVPTQTALTDAGYNYAWLFVPPIVDCPNMLSTMLNELSANNKADVNVETGLEYESIDNIMEDAHNLNCDGIINCTGLGSSKLCNDDQLIGARGVLLHYDRKTCRRRRQQNDDDYMMFTEDNNGKDVNILVEDGPWGSETMPCYLITRGNTIVVGGSYLEGDTEPTIRGTEQTKLLENARRLGIDTESSKPVGSWVGFRPYRKSNCRLELDREVVEDEKYRNIRLVHSYGYGGSGWTVYVGAAKEAANLLLEG